MHQGDGGRAHGQDERLRDAGGQGQGDRGVRVPDVAAGRPALQ